MANEPVDNKEVIEKWLIADNDALDITVGLMQRFKDNGWDYESEIDEYMDDHAMAVSHNLYKRAITFVQSGGVN